MLFTHSVCLLVSVFSLFKIKKLYFELPEMKMEVAKDKFKVYKCLLKRNKFVAHLIYCIDMKFVEEDQFFVTTEF